jgi:hypothetical protein
MRKIRQISAAAGLLALGITAAAAPALARATTPSDTPTPTAPPPVTSLVHGIGNQEGDFFITPTGDTSTYANGPEIVDGQGNVVWFHAVPTADTAADFREQTTTESRSSRGGRALGWVASRTAPTSSTTSTASRSRPSPLAMA